MVTKLMVPGLALAATLALAGCGSSGASGSPSTSAAAPSSSGAAAPSTSGASSSASSSGSGSTPLASSSPSTGSAPATIKDPCKVLSAGKVSAITGVEVKNGTTSTIGPAKACIWLPKNPATTKAAAFITQEGPLGGGTLKDAAEQGLKSAGFKGNITQTSVPGADDARYASGKLKGTNAIDVLTRKGDVFYQVIAATQADAGQHRDEIYKLVETLMKG